MRIAVWSNAPHAPTGYGQQCAQLTKRLKADGHEVAVIANWGLTGAPMTTDDGVMVFPQGSHPYSIDVADIHARNWFGGEPGTIIVLYDTWPLLENPDFLKDHDVWYWAPIDHSPAPPRVQEWCRSHDVIAMSEFGARELTNAGMAPGYTIHHAIERDVFRPTESDIREQMGIGADAHLTTTVMANIGQTPLPRKMWFENLLAWRIFAEQHDDAHIYIHTQLRHPRGVDLASFIKLWGLPIERVHIVDQGAYVSGIIGPDKLAAIYSASDVTLMATAGEGFGIPAIESIATGTPVIGTNFSAQPEVIGDAGWLVPYLTFFDYQQGAAQALPLIDGIADALERSYTEGRGAYADKCAAQAAKFDADTVYADKWRPFLADREAKPNREQRRRNNRC